MERADMMPMFMLVFELVQRDAARSNFNTVKNPILTLLNSDFNTLQTRNVNLTLLTEVNLTLLKTDFNI